MSIAIQIKQAELDDVDAVYRICVSCFPNMGSWNKSAFRWHVISGDALCVIASYGDKIIGFTCGALNQSAHTLYLSRIGVMREFRGLGVGTSLTKELISTCMDMCDLHVVLADVSTSNYPSMLSLKSLGFVECSLKLGYYQETSEDAISFRKLIV